MLNFDRKAVRILVGLLAGSTNMSRLMEAVLCSFCQEEEKTAIRVLSHCESLKASTTKERLLKLGSEKFSGKVHMREILSGLWNLIKGIGLDRVL